MIHTLIFILGKKKSSGKVNDRADKIVTDLHQFDLQGVYTIAQT